MTPRLRRSRLQAVARTVTALALASIGLAAGGNPAYATSYTAISGSGSSWASVALDAWSSNLRRSGIVINYNPDGSAAGRSDYINNQDDFAGSIPRSATARTSWPAPGPSIPRATPTCPTRPGARRSCTTSRWPGS